MHYRKTMHQVVSVRVWKKKKREHFWGISCEKSRFYAKQINFSPILGAWGVCRVHPPPWIRPWECLLEDDCSTICAKIPFARTLIYQRSFFLDTIRIWNNLPAQIVEQSSSRRHSQGRIQGGGCTRHTPHAPKIGEKLK
jgi:hypothetical protein